VTFSFSHKETSTLLSAKVEFYWGKTAKSRFVSPLDSLRCNVHGSFVAYWKARGRLLISANWTFFASSHGWGAV